MAVEIEKEELVAERSDKDRTLDLYDELRSCIVNANASVADVMTALTMIMVQCAQLYGVSWKEVVSHLKRFWEKNAEDHAKQRS